jgi:Na+/alanine symporter
MTNKTTKWLIYTVLVGLLPILSRIVVWLTSKPDSVHIFAATDFVALGLVLHISSINELEHVSSETEHGWKTIQNGVSLTFVALYSVLYAVLLIGEKSPSIVDVKAMLYCVASLAAVSFILTLSVFHRLSRLAKKD